jgi:acetylornithine deacetylase/succinyl-diaminopimelate desuccinylase-like protein
MSDQQRALTYVRTHRERFLDELRAFLSIPSISTQAAHNGDVARAAAWLRDGMVAAGFGRAKVMPTGGHPVVYGACAASRPDASTVLIYGHYDVQPADPLEAWTHPPFQPTVVGDDVYARGASDDKGQLYAHVKAVESFCRTVGAPPVHVKCIFEGEEESGSRNLASFVETHTDLLRADVAVISDTHILGKTRPSIVYALRGIAAAEVEVTGPAHDLHSGTYGGAVHNPLHALAEMIARLHDADGCVAIPGFYDAVRDLDEEERSGLAAVPFERAAWLEETGVKSEWGEAGYTVIERTTARPTLDVNGMWGGYTGPGGKTILPSKAHAKITTRLVPDQDPERIARLLRDYLLEIAPPTVSVEVRTRGGGRPAVLRRDSLAMRAASRAYALAFGREPAFVREGGSIPVVAVLQQTLGLEPVLMGFGLPDDRLHSPNEKMHLPNFYRGIETACRFLMLLGENGA